jgi:hypothetical protein
MLKRYHALVDLEDNEDLPKLVARITSSLLSRDRLYFLYSESQYSFFVFYMKSSYFVRMKLSISKLPCICGTKLAVEASCEEGDRDLFFDLFHFIKDSISNTSPKSVDSLDGNVWDSFDSLSLDSPSKPRISRNAKFYAQNQVLLSHWIDLVRYSPTNNYEERLLALQSLYNLTSDRQDCELFQMLEDRGLVVALLAAFRQEFRSSDRFRHIFGANSNSNPCCSMHSFPVKGNCLSADRKNFQYFLLLTLANFIHQESAIKLVAKESELIHFLSDLANTSTATTTQLGDENSCFLALQLIPIRENCHLLLAKILSQLSWTAIRSEIPIYTTCAATERLPAIASKV